MAVLAFALLLMAAWAMIISVRLQDASGQHPSAGLYRTGGWVFTVTGIALFALLLVA